ncbi:MAG: AbrB/MazE/SpoVT family DNA-binding domain-containing protein [Patescibacteria group bacterium]
MTIGTIVKPNQKGQIVIPKEYRDELAIDSSMFLNLVMRGKGIYIYPIAGVVSKADSESSYLNVLKKTQGKWNENWEDIRKKRRRIELSAYE